MWKRISLALSLLLASAVGAAAQTPTTYSISNGLGSTYTFRTFNCSGPLCTASVPIDYNGIPLTGPAGTPSTQAMTVQGIAGGQPLIVQPSNTPNTVPWLTTISQGGNNAVVNASGQLAINCANCSGSGVSQVDATTFTQGSSNLVPFGGIFTNAISNLSSGQAGVAQLTNDRMLYINVGKVGGTATLTGTGVVGAGAQRIAVAQDANTIAGSAPGTAGTASANVLSVQGEVGMTPVQISQATSSNLKAQVDPLTPASWGIGATAAAVPANAQYIGINTGGNLVGWTGAVTNAGTFAVQLTGATNNINNIAGTISLPTGASTSANQTSGAAKSQIVDGSGNVIASTSNNLNVQCANCTGSGVSAVDEASFTAGTSLFAAGGGFFQTSATSNPLTNGQQGAFQLTANRALFSNLRNASGTEVGTAAAPLQVSLANTAANSTAVLVTGTGGSFPITASALPLPNNASQETGGNLAVLAGAVISSVLQDNIKQVNGVTTLAGAGVVGTGSIRVAVGQDTTTIAGSAPGTAGVSSANVVSVQGVPSMTPVQVSQATAASLNATVVNAGTFAVQATQSGNWTARVVGNAGAAFDAAAGATAAPNGLQAGGVFVSSPPTLSNGQFNPFLMDAAARLVVSCAVGCSSTGGSSLADEGTFTQGTTSFTVAGGIYATSITNLSAGQGGAARVTPDRFLMEANAMSLATLSAWNTSTGSNATQTIMASRGAPAIVVQLDQTTTLTGGAVTWEGTYDGTNWVTMNAAQVVDPTSSTLAQIANPYTFQASTNKPFLLFPAGMQSLRMRLSTTITGTGSVTPFVTTVDSQAAQAIIQGATFLSINAGVASFGSTLPTTGVAFGGDALTTEPSLTTSGNMVAPFMDRVGKTVTSPYAARELQWRGGGTSTSTAAITLLAAAGAGVKAYMTDLSCTRNDTGTTAISVTLSDASAMQFDIPDNGGGGGYVKTFNVPLVTAANTALTVTPGTGVTTLKCWASGFTGY